MNIQAKQKAKELIEWFYTAQMQANQDHFGNQLISTELVMMVAKKCATKVCDEALSDMGSDRGYEFWTDVKQAIQDYE